MASCESDREQLHKYLSIIVDGMDQRRTEIPYLMCILPKKGASTTILKCHLIDLCVHGRGSYGFWDIHQYQHDSNLIISVILHELSMMQSFPSTLYLQTVFGKARIGKLRTLRHIFLHDKTATLCLSATLYKCIFIS